MDRRDRRLGHLHRGSTLRLPDITLERRLTLGFWIATLTFVGILLLIALEKLLAQAALTV